MRLNRLRHGELLALVAAIGLLVVLLLDWYDARDPAAAGGRITTYAPIDGHTTGIASVGWFAAGMALLAVVVCLAWLFATVTQESPALPVAGEVTTIALGLLASIGLLSRLVFQPGLGVGLGNAQVDLLVPAYIGPALAVLLTVGAWKATADERTDAPYSQPGEIELRPIPE
jgi:hypothetical protein